MTGITLTTLEAVLETDPELFFPRADFLNVMKGVTIRTTPAAVTVKIKGNTSGGVGFDSVAALALFSVNRLRGGSAPQFRDKSMAITAGNLGVRVFETSTGVDIGGGDSQS